MTVARLFGGRFATVLTAAVLLAGYGAGAWGQLNCNVGIEFHPTGGIESCRLNGNHALETAAGIRVTCADGEVAQMYADGRLKSCTLAEPLSLDAVRCEVRARIEFDGDGAIAQCAPS